MADQRLKDLRGPGRRQFIKWSTAVAAAMGVERARYLDFLGDRAGVAMADTTACASTAKSVHLIGDNGGLAWFTQLFPYPDVAHAQNASFAYYAKTAVDAKGTDNPLVYAPDSPFQTLPANRQMSVFVAGTNQTHTKTPTSGLTIGNNGLIASVSAIQAANPTLLPVMAVNPFVFGSAPGAAQPANVANSAGLVDLFDSAASKTLLATPQSADLDEAYYKAFLGLNSIATRASVSKTYATGRTAVNLLGKNLSSQLAVSSADDTRYGITASTPTNIVEIAHSLCTGVKAFGLGLSSCLIVPAMQDDPHPAFQDVQTLTSNVQTLGKILNAFMADAMALPDPAGCSGKTLADSLVLTITGDTPKDGLTASGWPDGTASNHNLVFVWGGGWLKTGWFGNLDTQGNLTTWDPNSGAAGTQTSQALGTPAASAVAYAVTKGDARRVSDFGGTAPPGVIVANNM
ncbi:MAG TPA: hypothetical protein VIY73_14460 [Polyangiaceae bacterium]